MVVGVIELELHIPGCRSLKEKRFVIRSLKDRMRNRFNVAVSETAHQNVWQRAGLTAVTVSSDTSVAHKLLSNVEKLILREGRVEIIESQIEWL